MRIGPALEKNSDVYEVTSPDSWSDEKLNVSFGDYRVANMDMDTGWTTTRDSSSTGSFWTDLIYDAAGVSVGGTDDHVGDRAQSRRGR